MSLEQPVRIKSTDYMKKILYEYYIDLDKASKTKGEFVAWCSSAGPTEMLRSFGFKVYYPENHSAILGASRKANTFIPVSNTYGYSPDICSYLTSDIGAYLQNYTPLTESYGLETVPKPDVLVYNTNQCRDVQDWFRFYSERLGIPLIGIHSPSFVPEVTEADIVNVTDQFHQLIPTLEKVSDKKFDIAKLREIVQLSKQATDLWREVLESAKHSPSPISFFDSGIHMAPIVLLRGEQVAIEYYQTLRNEMNQRLEENIAAVPNETIRLYWDGMPIWGKLRALSNLFIESEACVVASTYCNSWIFSQLDPQDPIRSMAKAYTELFINRDEDFKEKYLIKTMKEFNVDGIIYHDCKTCPNNSNNRYQLPQRTHNKNEIPYITIDGDVNDLRCFSEEQTRTSLEAFIEQLKSYK